MKNHTFLAFFNPRANRSSITVSKILDPLYWSLVTWSRVIFTETQVPESHWDILELMHHRTDEDENSDTYEIYFFHITSKRSTITVTNQNPIPFIKVYKFVHLRIGNRSMIRSWEELSQTWSEMYLLLQCTNLITRVLGLGGTQNSRENNIIRHPFRGTRSKGAIIMANMSILAPATSLEGNIETRTRKISFGSHRSEE